MKNHIRTLIPLFGAVLVLPLARADQPPHLRVLAEAGGPDERPPHRFLIEHTGEKEAVAFLGVETTPVPPVVTAQLNLPKESGLVVRHVVAKSPADGVLAANDILLKLDDQLLIEPRQFAVLVRAHKEGDEVTLTYYRGGKETTAKVKLSKHDVPKLAGPAEDRLKVRVAEERGQSTEDMRRVLDLLERNQGPQARPGPRMMVTHDPELRALTVHPNNSSMVYSDDKGSLELTIKDGKKTLVAKNAKGDTLFTGPIDTPEQRKSLAPEVRGRLEQIEGMDGFSFEADGDFHAEMKAQPAATKIGLVRIEADEDDDAPEALQAPVPPAY